MQKPAKTTYDFIKKQNGETFAQLIRKFDNGIFEIPNIIEIVKFAGRDAEPIIEYLVSLKNIKIDEIKTGLSPYDLLKQAGYNSFYVDTLEKQNSIKKYFKSNEELCTFKDKDRFTKYHVIHCIKENVDKIQRSQTPNRQDDYGTSVISIQILKTGRFISIKNRYNQSVGSPDNTFSSNPDNIIAGLSSSIKTYFNIDFSSQKEMLKDSYTIVNDQIIKYNFEINNVYFGEDFWAKDGKIHKIDKTKQIMMDYFIFDIKTRELLNVSENEDDFPNALLTEIKDKKLQITNSTDGTKNLFVDNVCILKLTNGQIKEINFHNATTFGDDFLYRNEVLESFSANNATTFGDDFLNRNKVLKSFSANNAITFGDYFLYNNEELKSFSANNATTFGGSFLCNNEVLESFSANNAITFGDYFLYNNEELKSFIANNATTFEDDFLYNNKVLESFIANNAITFGDNFLYNNKVLKSFIANNATTFGSNFLYNNEVLESFSANNATTFENSFLYNNKVLKRFSANNATTFGNNFLYNNEELKSFIANNAITFENSFLYNNKVLKSFIANNAITVVKKVLIDKAIYDRQR